MYEVNGKIRLDKVQNQQNTQSPMGLINHVKRRNDVTSVYIPRFKVYTIFTVNTCKVLR